MGFFLLNADGFELGAVGDRVIGYSGKGLRIRGILARLGVERVDKLLHAVQACFNLFVLSVDPFVAFVSLILAKLGAVEIGTGHLLAGLVVEGFLNLG